MLRRKQRHQLHAGCLVQQVQGLSAQTVTAGMIGDQAHPFALQRFEPRLSQHIHSIQHSHPNRVRRPVPDVPHLQLTRALQPTDRNRPLHVRQRLRRQRPYPLSQGPDVACLGRMIPVRHQDHEGRCGRVDPHRSAGPTGVPIRAEFKTHPARPGIG